MSRITQQTIEQIKERIPVSQVVARYVQLKRAGREWRALSPFGKERTPSFYVNDQKGFYHCFSTGKHGTAIDFVMQMSGLSFPEAVETLAKEAGIEVTRDGLGRETRESQQARADALGALRCAQSFFRRQLQLNPEAQRYLNARDIRQKTARELGIGWAPPPGRCLLEHLADEGFSTGTMIEAGLAAPSEDGRLPRPFFHSRITLPIRNRQGDVISFGARGICNEQPKYINGRETPLFDKGRQLYNLDRARQAIARSGQSIVVEGYFDVAALVQAQVENVVAPLGTALTVEHLHLLWRVAPHIIYCADGDEAGRRAGDRTLETALPWVAGDRRLSFAELPNGLDPDDLLRASGVGALNAVLRSTQSVTDRLWLSLRAESPGDAPEDRAKIERAIAERLKVVAEPEMRRAFADELIRRARKLGTGKPHQGPASVARRSAAAIPAREAALVVAAVLHPEYVESELEAFASAEVRAPVCAMLRDLVVTNASTGAATDMDSIARDVALLRSALPDPEPSFVSGVSLDSFREALSMQSAQSIRRRLQASYSPQAAV